MKEEGEYRSFRVTEYKDVTVQVYEMTDIANSVENNIYSICVAEMKKIFGLSKKIVGSNGKATI